MSHTIPNDSSRIEDKPAFQKTLEIAKFDSVHGPTFKLNNNHLPNLDWYTSDLVSDGRCHAYIKIGSASVRQYQDSHATECEMK